MSDGKEILSEGLDIADDVYTNDPARSTLPFATLSAAFSDGSKFTVSCVLSSIDSRSVSLSEFSLWCALQILVASRSKTLALLVLKADDMVFEFSPESDIYISAMGSTCLLSLTSPRDE